MCSICHNSPCLSRCPNAKTPHGLHKCTKCGHFVDHGIRYAMIDGDCYCEDCLDGLSTKELVELCGWKFETEPDEYEDSCVDDEVDERIFETVSDRW